MRLIQEGGGAGSWAEQFPRRSFRPEWKRDDGRYDATQVTSEACENGTYRAALAIVLEPPPGYRYEGPIPLAAEYRDTEVTNCPPC